MMDKSKEPAFPFNAQEDNVSQPIEVAYYGLTKREYFAGQAMIGFAANIRFGDRISEMAESSFRFADEMLKAGEK